jgi:hypothetical protein
MFRLVINDQKKPCMFILCDHAHCMRWLAAELGGEVPEQAQVNGFWAHLHQKMNWQVRPYGQYCPEHHDAMKLEPPSPIVLASNVPGVAKMPGGLR